MSDACLRARLVQVGGTRGDILQAGQGQGPTVVIVASMLVLARTYIRPLRELSKRFHTIVVQLPGGGRGAPLSSPWSMQQYAHWTGQLLDVMSLENVTLVGHSNSGPVVAMLAARDARRIGRIVLTDSIGADEAFSLARIILARGYDIFLEPELSIEAWNHVVLNAVYHLPNFANQVRLSSSTDLRGIAQRVSVPALVAWGAYDHTMPLRCAHLLRSLLPEAHFYVSPTGSHDWMIDHPVEFGAALGEFVRATSRSRRLG